MSGKRGWEYGRLYTLREIDEMADPPTEAITYTLEDVILLLLHADPRPIEGKPRLMKEVFLALGDVFPWPEAERVGFRPHRFGPYSERVYAVADQLAFVNKVKVSRDGGAYGLAIAPRGREHIGAKFDALPARTRERLVQKRAEWDALTPAGIRDLVRTHYEAYLESTGDGTRRAARAAGEGRAAARIALFLGAGASVPYGMPTTRELRDKIGAGDPAFPRKDLLDYDRFPDIEHVLSALGEVIAFAETRAGELYAEHGGGGSEDGSGGSTGRAFSTGAARRRGAYKISSDAFRTHVAESRRAKEIVERLITRHYRWDPSNDRRAALVLGPLLDLAKSAEGHVTVFTTNYDTVIESYCGNPDRQAECIDGFSLHSARRVHVWSDKFVPRHPNYRTKVFLYKLHGSMNWLADGDGRGARIVQKPDTGASDDRSRDMYIRPSLDTKGVATQKEPYATILRRFRLALPSFDACIVVGYSFRDPHVSEELVKFARSGKALVVLSPTAASDFEANALKGARSFGAGGGQGGEGRLRSMTLSSGGREGIVYALDEKLGRDGVDGTIGAIKTAIRRIALDSETGVEGRMRG